MPIRTANALLVFLPALVAACDCPTGPSRIDFSAQSTLTRLTLSRGETTLVTARGSGEFHVTSPVGAPHRLSFRVEFPPDAPVSHGVYVSVTEDVSLHSERLGTRDDFHSYETGRGVPGADYELAFVSGKRPGRHTIRVTVEESAGEGSGLLQVAELTIHLTLEAPSSEAQSDLLYLDLTAGGERGDADAETLLVTSESGVFEVTSIVDTPHTLDYSVFVPPRAPVRRTVTITLTENYSVAAARDNAPTSTVVVHQTGEGGYDDRVSLALTGPHFRSRSTPGLYRAGLRIEETGAGLPPGGTLVDEAIIHLTLEPR